jgi:regulator of microtubule dynamics protein 3
MRRLTFKAYLLIIILCIICPALKAEGNSAENEKLLKQAGKLLSSYKDSEALLIYEQVISSSATNYEALCKASFLHSRIGDRYSDETRKLNHFAKAREYAEKAYEINPKDAESNYVMALALGCKAMVSGPKERLVGINEVKSFLDAALADNNEHAGAWHILGRWYFKMANLNFAEKAAAKLLFGGVCGIVTNQDAADAIEKAITYNTHNIRYYFDLASVYSEMKDEKACIATLEKALALNLETQEELELSRRCRLMLKDKKKI